MVFDDTIANIATELDFGAFHKEQSGVEFWALGDAS